MPVPSPPPCALAASPRPGRLLLMFLLHPRALTSSSRSHLLLVLSPPPHAVTSFSHSHLLLVLLPPPHALTAPPLAHRRALTSSPCPRLLLMLSPPPGASITFPGSSKLANATCPGALGGPGTLKMRSFGVLGAEEKPNPRAGCTWRSWRPPYGGIDTRCPHRREMETRILENSWGSLQYKGGKWDC